MGESGPRAEGGLAVASRGEWSRAQRCACVLGKGTRGAPPLRVEAPGSCSLPREEGKNPQTKKKRKRMNEEKNKTRIDGAAFHTCVSGGSISWVVVGYHSMVGYLPTSLVREVRYEASAVVECAHAYGSDHVTCAGASRGRTRSRCTVPYLSTARDPSSYAISVPHVTPPQKRSQYRTIGRWRTIRYLSAARDPLRTEITYGSGMA
eukprot:867356-Rhodomonas_salina.1